MKQTLPWNVNNIPPEARDIARSAAQREGLSVGDWLTRRILGNGSLPHEETQGQPPFRQEQDDEARQPRESLAVQGARSDSQSESAFRRIDEALRIMTQRLESTERSQHEANRAMSSAASDINAAARDQVQAFLLLNERIERVERHADTTALRDAVRGLHQGLSRLADQIGRTANESTGQIAALAGNVETLSGKIAQARDETAKLGHFVEIGLTSLSERLNLAEDRIASGARLEETVLKLQEDRAASSAKIEEIAAKLQERGDSGTQIERAVARLEERIAAGAWLEEAVARLDEERVASGTRLEDIIASLEHERLAAADRLSEIVARLDERLAAGAQLGDSVARLQAEHTASDALLHETLLKLEEERIASGVRLGAAVAKLEDRIETERAASAMHLDETAGKLPEHIVTPAQLGDALAGLEARLDANSAKFESKLSQLDARGTVGAHLEDSVAKLETRLNSAEERVQDALGRHLASIERTLENIAQRLDQAERRGGEADGNVRDSLHSLGQRFEASDQKTRDALTELRASLGATTKRVEAIEPPASLTEQEPAGEHTPSPEFDAPAMAAAFALNPPDSYTDARADAHADVHADALEVGLDLPPFPDAPPFPTGTFTPSSPDADFLSAAAFGSEPLRTAEADSGPVDPTFSGSELARSELADSTLDYLAQARRAAQSSDPAAPRGARAAFTLIRGEDRTAEAESDGKGKSLFSRPIVVAAGIVLVIAAGFAVTRSLSGRHQLAALPPAGKVALGTSVKPVPGKPASANPGETDSVADAAKNSANQVASLTGPNAILAPAAPAAASNSPNPKAEPANPKAAPDGVNAPAGTPLARLTAKAAAGNSQAELLLGIRYADGDGMPANEAQAVSWLKKAAVAGEPLAQYRLGTLYEKGRGVAVDAKEATILYGDAARHGNRKAMHNLAVAYADGAGVDKNFTEAAHWFKSASELGLTDSEFNLAVLYERGLGVPASLSDAYKWYAIAAAAGDMESKARVDALATQLQPDAKDAADKAAKAFKPAPMSAAANDAPTIEQVVP